MNVSKNITNTIIIGFAFFTALFGAGNLIFPPAIGVQTGGEWLSALIGFVLSGVMFPVLVLVAVARAGGTEEGISSEMGETFSVLFISVVMLCTSLLIAVPRTAAVTHELGVVTIFGDVPQILTSCVYFAIVFYFSLNPSTVVEKLGKYFGPILLVIMTVIIVKGVFHPLGVPFDTGFSGASAFHLGFVDGYQTLDVFCALVVSGAMIAAIAALQPDNRRAQVMMASGSALVAALGLLFIYGGLIYIGATGSDLFGIEMGNSAILIGLINALFRGHGSLILACAAIFACITTAIGLAAGASYFFSRVTKGKLSYKASVIIICVVSLLFSTLGVDAIIRYAEPILVFIYPTTIALVLLNVFRCRIMNRGTFFGVTYGTLAVGFVEMFPAMGLREEGYVVSAIEALPLFEYGLVWIVPAIVCGVLGTIGKAMEVRLRNVKS
jgi:LIVCS family branched-chain amino acid:cation transporter